MTISQSQIVSRQYPRQHWRRGTYASLLLASCATISLLANTQAFAVPTITYTGAVTPVPPQGVTDWDWSPAQVMIVGNNGAGTLNINDGATASGDTIYIGNNNGASQTAALNVDGQGSAITTTHIYLGTGHSGDDGILTISNGGRVDSNSNDAASIMIGEVTGATGHIVVTGHGSSLNSNNVIILGFLGAGDLKTTDGGQATGYQLYLGNTNTGVGTATIAGNGSAWNGQHGVWVGQFGTGTLNLFDGGSINDNSLQIAYDIGTTGTVNIGGAEGDPAKVSGNLNVNTITFNSNGGGSNGTLNFNTTDGTTIRAAISGEGTINQIAGTTVFTGDNSAFVGPVNITGGTLQLGDGGNTGNLAVDVDTGSNATHKGTLAFNRADEVSFDHIITGAGSVQQMGNGTTTLTRDNRYTGGTLITAGTLSASSDANLGDVAGGLTLDGGTLQVTGTTYNSTMRTVTLGDHGGGLDIADASNSFTVAQEMSGIGSLWKRGDGTLILSENNTFSGGLSVEKGIAQAGIADNAFGSGRLTVNAGATADLNDFNTTVAGLLDGQDGGGSVTLGTGTLTLQQDFDNTFSGAISGIGGLTKNETGTLTLSGSNSYSGVTTLNGGTLKQGAQGGLSSASAYTIGTDATLMLNGFNTAMTSLANSGVTDFGGTGGTALIVAGNYIGGGTLVLNTVLGDDNSKTDILKVSGDTSGTTTVKVNNSGVSGAPTNEGIKIIDVAGQSNGVFNLSGNFTTKDGQQAVTGGAYAYTLHKNGIANPNDGAWYLRSQLKNEPQPSCEDTETCPPVNPPRYNPGTSAYEGYGQTMQALNKLPTLQQRVGNRYWSGTANPVIEQSADALDTPHVPADATIDVRGIWGRIEGAHNRFEANRSTTAMKQDIDTFIMQAGVDGQLYEGEIGKLIGGITGQYGKANSKITSDHGDGKIDTHGWGLGGTLTWYDDNGFYADAQAQAMWYDSDLNSITANQSLTNGNKGFGYGLSLEAGKRIDLDANWSLTPQAQLVWSSVKFDTFEDAWGASVSSRNGDSLNARLGLSADYRTAWRDENGMITRGTVYGIVNLYQEFMSGNKATVADVDFNNENDKTWGGIGAGGTYAWADDKYALYGEGSLNTSLSNFADSYSVKGTVGFRVKW